MVTSENLYDDLAEVMLTREQIAEAVAKLGKRITADYQNRPLVLIGVLKGVVVFFTDLMRQISLPLEIDFMAVSSYGNSTTSNGQPMLLKDITADVAGKDVLIVEDIVDTGRTLLWVKHMLEGRGAASVRVATLMNKPARRCEEAKKELEVEYICFDIADEFVVGYGLDYAEKYRNLPEIGVLAPRVYGGE